MKLALKKIQNPYLIQKIIIEEKNNNKSIGFIPTMGSLHEGHLSLIKASIVENDITVVSIFVNSKQFNNKKDLIDYPRNLDKDIKILNTYQVDYLFYPMEEDIYFKDNEIEFNIKNLANYLCGIYRPGHFQAVVNICMILFQIIPAHHVYFGQKDYQQSLIIKKLIRDFFIPIQFHLMPTIREKNGMPMSSRNTLLSKEDKNIASQIYFELQKLKKNIEAIVKDRNFENLITLIKNRKNQIKMLEEKYTIKIEYFEICHGESLQNFENIEIKNFNLIPSILIAIAFYIKNVRLIDNFLIPILK